MKKELERLKRLLLVLRYYLLRDSNAFLYLIREEALSYLNQCKELGVGNIEEVEDLIFHINSYIEIPNVLKGTLFNGSFRDIRSNPFLYTSFLTEIEKERAVERECICDLLKTLPIGFKI